MALPLLNNPDTIGALLKRIEETSDSGLMLVAETLENNLGPGSGIVESLNNLKEAIVGGFQGLVDYQEELYKKQDELRKIQAARDAEKTAELERLTGDTGSRVASIADTGQTPGGGGLGSIIGVGIFSALLAYATGLDQAIRALKLPETLKAIKNFAVGIADFFTLKNFSKIVDGINNKIVAFFDDIFKNLRLGFKVGQLGEEFANLRELVLGKTGFLGQVGAFFGDLVQRVRSFMAPVLNPVIKFFTNLQELVAPIFSGDGVIAKILGGLGRVFKFLGGPITMAIFAVLDFINGFMEELQDTDSIFAALAEGTKEIFRGFVTKPLDLLKDILGWVAGKLGFESMSKSLQDFSFTDVFDSIAYKIQDWVVNVLTKYLPDWAVPESIKSLRGAGQRREARQAGTPVGARPGLEAQRSAVPGTEGRAVTPVPMTPAAPAAPTVVPSVQAASNLSGTQAQVTPAAPVQSDSSAVSQSNNNDRVVTQINVTESLVSTVKKLEGFSAKAYPDFKQFSIGYGTKAKSSDEVITEPEADKRLREELAKRQKFVIDYGLQKGYSWNQNQVDSLTSFVYNLGLGALNQVTANGTRTNEEIASKMGEYNKAGGQVNKGLVARRGNEVAMFTGQPPTSPSIPTSAPQMVAQKGITTQGMSVGVGSTQVAAAKENSGTVVSTPVIAPTNNNITNVSRSSYVMTPDPRSTDPTYLAINSRLMAGTNG